MPYKFSKSHRLPFYDLEQCYQTPVYLVPSYAWVLLFNFRRNAPTNRLLCYRGIAERFWDATNTPHLSFVEITITAFGFATLTGPKFFGDPYQFHHHLNSLSQLFGPVKENIPCCILYTTLCILMYDHVT